MSTVPDSSAPSPRVLAANVADSPGDDADLAADAALPDPATTGPHQNPAALSPAPRTTGPRQGT